jgi:cytidylate kinase
MTDVLLEYFEKRLMVSETKRKTNPVFITISRQTACNGNQIAEKLSKRLSNINEAWKYINKEILEESSKKLKLKNSKLNNLFSAEHRSHVDEILSALSNRYYASDRKLKKTVSELIRHYAEEGNTIIVGRAGVGITKGMKGGMHIRLVAPLEWRIKALENRKGFENVDAESFIQENDKQKIKLLERLCGLKSDEIIFDMTLNCEVFEVDQIVDMIIKAVKIRSLI